MKFEIKHRLTGELKFSIETSSWKLAIEAAIKANADLSYADLSYANLSSANLSSADLSYADLSSADLSYADLSSANLSYANLSSADLSYARLDKKYIQVAGIGSANRMTTYCVEDNIIWCGCFVGTLEEFITRFEKTHQNNSKFIAEYSAAVTFFKTVSKAQKQIENLTPAPEAGK